MKREAQRPETSCDMGDFVLLYHCKLFTQLQSLKGAPHNWEYRCLFAAVTSVKLDALIEGKIEAQN